MDIGMFIDKGVELELKVSKIYEKLSHLTRDEALSKRLAALSGEEINHANTLRMGRKFLAEMPDLFAGFDMKDEELEKGLADTSELLAGLERNPDFSNALQRIIHLERQYEKIHLSVSVKVQDQSLKDLFKSLSRGDQNHVHILMEMIAGLNKA